MTMLETGEEILAEAQSLGYTKEIVDRWIQFFGEKKTEQIIKANEIEIPVTLRVNTVREGVDSLTKRLESNGWEVDQPDWQNAPHALDVIHNPVPIGASVEYLQGRYTIQGLPSQVAVQTLDITGDVTRVADLGAAPGGKTTYIAQLMDNKGVIVSLEYQQSRMKSLLSNIERLGVQNVVCAEADARNINFQDQFDRILLDAPCTGSGIIRKDQTRKYSRTEVDVIKLSKIQKQLLMSGIRMLAQGGKIVYSTCSLEPEENEMVISSVLSEFNDLKLLDPLLDDHWHNGLYGWRNISKELRKSKRIFPFDGREGFFIAVLCRE